MRPGPVMAALLLASLASGCTRATSAASAPAAAGATGREAQPTLTPPASQAIALPPRNQSNQLGPAAQVAEITGTLSEYSISLSEDSAKPGPVRFTVQNIGRRKHNLRVVGNGVDRVTRDLAPGQTGRVEARFVDPGPYTVYCDLADHADRGMQLTFTIEA